jgi:hypothetical protein
MYRRPDSDPQLAEDPKDRFGYPQSRNPDQATVPTPPKVTTAIPMNAPHLRGRSLARSSEAIGATTVS